MKNIHNIVSDAFVAAHMDESKYTVDIQSITEEESRIFLVHKTTEERFFVLIRHSSNGRIASVLSFENTLFPNHGFSYTTFLDTIYDADYMYF